MDDKQKIGFIQGVVYSAGLIKKYCLNAEQLIEESGITIEEIRKYADDYDLQNLELKDDE